MRLRLLACLGLLLLPACSDGASPGDVAADGGAPAGCDRAYQADVLAPAHDHDVAFDPVHLSFRFEADTAGRNIRVADEHGVDHSIDGTSAGVVGDVETWDGNLEPQHTYTLTLSWQCVRTNGTIVDLPLMNRTFYVEDASPDAGLR